MRKVKYILLFGILFSPLGLCLSLEELDAKLESGDGNDFIEADAYIERVIDGDADLDHVDKIAVAMVLYKYRDELNETVLQDNESDVIYNRGRGWVVSRMARLTSYVDHLPDEVRNQTGTHGSLIDQIAQLYIVPAKQEKFLEWFESTFNNKFSHSDGIEDFEVGVDREGDKSGQKPNFYNDDSKDDKKSKREALDSSRWLWMAIFGIVVCAAVALVALLCKRRLREN